MGASRPFGRAIGSSNSRPKSARDDTPRPARNAVTPLPHIPWRSHLYVAFLVCRIERRNSTAASAYATMWRPVLPRLALFGLEQSGWRYPFLEAERTSRMRLPTSENDPKRA